MTKKDGGPAFPIQKVLETDSRTGAPVRTELFPGASLRDLFAAHALTGLIANPRNEGSSTEIAYLAYGIADALLVERDKR